MVEGDNKKYIHVISIWLYEYIPPTVYILHGCVINLKIVATWQIIEQRRHQSELHLAYLGNQQAGLQDTV